MENAGSALMGIGYGSGENRAIEAARAAIDSPLLELSIAGAKGLLFNITGGTDLSMFEVDEAARIITESCDPEANIIFGATINENYTGEIKITVVATGFNEESNQRHYEAPRMQQSGFGKKPVHAPATSNALFGNAVSAPRPAAEPASDLDVPAFLRNKMK